MTAEAREVQSGVTEAGIRAAIAQLELLLPERSCSTRDLWTKYAASLPVDQEWVRGVKAMMWKALNAPLAEDGKESLGDIQVIAIRSSHWSDYKNGPGKCLSPTTRNLQLRRIKAMLNWAIDDGRIYDSPFRRVKMEPARSKRETEISEEDEARIVGTAPLHVSVLIRVAMGSGMRHDEVRLLRWEQIDFATQTLTLLWDENKGRKPATVNLTQDAIAALRLMRPVPGNPYVFASKRKAGEALSYQHFWTHFRETVDGLGVKAAPGDRRVHAHDTRHSVASRLNRRGAKLTDIQGVLRHANLATTAAYIHTRADEIAAAAALLEQPRRGPRRAPASEKSGSEIKKASSL